MIPLEGCTLDEVCSNNKDNQSNCVHISETRNETSFHQNDISSLDFIAVRWMIESFERCTEVCAKDLLLRAANLTSFLMTEHSGSAQVNQTPNWST